MSDLSEVQSGRRNLEGVELQTEGVQEEAYFAISQEDAVQLMKILRDSLYTRKPLALLREYGANAWDEHRKHGIERPIEVALPTMNKPVLKIRDFARGLSRHDVLRVYTQYGKSTKRGDSVGTGHLGIGCKAGFCYAEQYTVTSWFGGTKSIYIASLDPTGRGKMMLLDEQPCGEETGIEVQIAVKPKDLSEFYREARELFRHYDPLPQINCDLPNKPRMRLKHGYLIMNDYEHSWVAVMGCNPYKVDLSQVGDTGLERFQRVSGALYFDMDEVDHASSREELQYTDRTKEAIQRKAEALLDEYATSAFASLRGQSQDNPWEVRQQIRFLKHEMRIKMPADMQDWAEDSVTLNPEGLFTVVRSHRTDNVISVEGSSRLLLVDDQRSLKGFHLQSGDYLVQPVNPTMPLSELRTALDMVLADTKLTGIQVGLLSSRPWYQEQEDSGRNHRKPNLKHKVDTFRLNPASDFEVPYSRAWDIESRTPLDSDVFVILNAFKALDCGGGFYEMYRQDSELVRFLGGTMPVIYGYKTVEKKPVKQEDCQGMHYTKWRTTYIVSLMKDEHLKLVEHYHWANIIQHPWRMNISVLDARDLAKRNLGDKHPVTLFLDKHLQGRIAVDKVSGKLLKSSVAQMVELISSTQENKAEVSREALGTCYPLLGEHDLLALFNNEESLVKWHDYIRLVDRDRAAQENLAQKVASAA